MLTALGMESVLRPYSDCTTYRERAKAPGRHGLLTNPHDDMSRMASNPAKQLVAADVFTAGVRARESLKEKSAAHRRAAPGWSNIGNIGICGSALVN